MRGLLNNLLIRINSSTRVREAIKGGQEENFFKHEAADLIQGSGLAIKDMVIPIS